MNDLTFGSTLLSILVTLAAAVFVEATSAPTRGPYPVIGNARRAPVQVASPSASDCACDHQVFALSVTR